MIRATLTSAIMLREAFARAVDAVVADDREIAALQARRAAAVDEARHAALALYSGGQADRSTGGPKWSNTVVIERVLVTELAVALRYSETDARRLIDTSQALLGVFADTRDALHDGRISYRHAEKIVKHAEQVPVERHPEFEQALLPVAQRVCAQRLDREARAAVELAQPTTAVARHLRAAAERRIRLEAAADGMAFLTHYLPAVEAVATYNRASDLARSLRTAGDPRTLTHLRADALTDLMLNGETSIPSATHGIRPRVHLTVPALALLTRPSTPGTSGTTRPDGHPHPHTARHPRATTHPTDTGPTHLDRTTALTTDPGSAHLEGYGPIDRLTALELTRDAPGFLRVLTDPITGCALTYGRERYRPPADLDDLIRLTHAECTFPTDCAPSSRADLDHTDPWEEGGETRFGNLSPLCSSHHKVKHHTEWMVEQHPDATITWTSPAGFAYTVAPTPIARPAPHFTAHPAPESAEAAARQVGDSCTQPLAAIPPADARALALVEASPPF
ncbi:HNH endonuclease signature motif containing protein [Subtercola sp. YIM 133946]|uniref:HNH endonuclease signature motif containing protein n=1 Tax=Subtercola sp. YIM 133946 TaxID=3118909 RepID=UPI002F92C221